MRRPVALRRPPARPSALASLALAALVAVAALPGAAGAQGWVERAKQRAKQRIDQQVDKAVDRTVDSAAATVTGAAGGSADATPAVPAANRRASAPAAPASETAPAGGRGADTMRPGEGAWANYDFRPGERVLFAEDFARDQVGDFPRRLTFQEGSMEVVEWNGGRWLRMSDDQNLFVVTLPEALPQRFTLEFDYSNPAGYGWGGLIVSFDGKHPYHQASGSRLRCNYDNAGLDARSGQTPQPPTAMKRLGGELQDQMYRCRVMVDGDYAKAYVNDTRVANLPNGAFPRGRQIAFYTAIHGQKPALLGNLRIAAGGRKLYDALAESGRVATQGIYFDTGSDRIRPESTPTLKEIAGMLAEHPELRLSIEGHTDNVGQAAANLSLSDRRAAAVRQALVAQFGVDAARLASKGLGQAKPAAANDTPEGRQQNRRVELVKM
jgi:outer membrane protein OmpA-like peptidoglycan-associated protein